MAKKNWKERSQSKVIDPSQLLTLVQKIRKQNQSIVTLNGSFDLLHAGHLHILFEAASQGDQFIVALNSDESIQKYKGPRRPIITLENRIRMMSSLECVDYVTWFYETTPLNLLHLIRPDIHVNGAEYGQNCIEREIVEKHGGKIHIVDLIAGLSTTNVIGKILKTCG